MPNALDKIATTKSAKSASVKVRMDLPENLRESLNRLIELKANIKKLLAEESDCEKKLIDYVRPKQDEEARAGHYTKSYELKGNSGLLNYSSIDKFSPPQEESLQSKLVDLIGKNKYDSFFEVKRAVSVKHSVLANDELVNTIVEVLEAKGIDNIFEVIDTTVSKKGLDARQYELSKDVHIRFRGLVPQAKPFLKEGK